MSIENENEYLIIVNDLKKQYDKMKLQYEDEINKLKNRINKLENEKNEGITIQDDHYNFRMNNPILIHR